MIDVDIQATWTTLLAALGGIAIIAGGVKVIVGLFSPFKALRERVDRFEEKREQDFQRFVVAEDSLKLLMRSLLVIIDHEMADVPAEKLMEIKEMLRTFLINRP